MRSVPLKWAGKLFFEKPQGSYVCSGQFITSYVILTAAHCLRDDETGDWFDDPNLTDKKFPGNPTRSYRSRAPLRIVGEVDSWTPHPPEVLQAMKDGLARLKAEGKDVIID